MFAESANVMKTSRGPRATSPLAPKIANPRAFVGVHATKPKRDVIVLMGGQERIVHK